jgi:hypothetical protein
MTHESRYPTNDVPLGIATAAEVPLGAVPWVEPAVL